MHIAQPKNKGFQKTESSSTLRGPGAPPAEAAGPIYESVDSEIMETVERYNIVMAFLSKQCKNENERQFASYMIINQLKGLANVEL